MNGAHLSGSAAAAAAAAAAAIAASTAAGMSEGKASSRSAGEALINAFLAEEAFSLHRRDEETPS
jgi:hypothetical protein